MLSLVLVAGVGLIVWLAGGSNREPIYKDRCVTEWIRDRNLFVYSAQGSRHNHAETALRAIGTNAVPYLVKDLHRKDSVLKKAWLSLWQRLPAKIQQRTFKLAVPDWSIRRTAAEILGGRFFDVRSATLDLAEALGDPDPGVQSEATRALSRIGADPEQFTPQLRVLLTNRTIRLKILRDLTQFRPGAEMTSRVLADVFAMSSSPEQEQILYLLQKIGPQAGPAVPTLITALSNSDNEIRYLAVRALEETGPNASAAIFPLMARLNDKHTMVANAAARALKRIHSEATAKPNAEK